MPPLQQLLDENNLNAPPTAPPMPTAQSQAPEASLIPPAAPQTVQPTMQIPTMPMPEPPAWQSPDKPTPSPTTLISNLSAHVRKKWESAYQHKQQVQPMLDANFFQYNSQYSPQKLAEIRKMDSSEVFIALTATKCNAAISWLEEILFSPNTKPWSIEPTPVPQLPLDVEQEITQNTIQEALNTVQQYCLATGEDPAMVYSSLKIQLRQKVDAALQERAKANVKDMEKELDDQLVEGGWYTALSKCLFDLTTSKNAFLKGPIYKKVKRFTRTQDMAVGTFTTTIEEDIIPTFERVSPYNIYPLPGTIDMNKGGIFEKIQLTRSDLMDLIGVEGFNEENIRAVIGRYGTGGLKDWTTFNSSQTLAQTSGSISNSTEIDTIDCLVYWDSVNGQMLLDYGLTPDEIEDKDRDYEVCVFLIGEFVIKAMLNPDPMGSKPYSMAGYSDLPDSFWKKGLPELIRDLQEVCNSIARAMVNNCSISSGPLVEMAIDRLDNPNDTTIWPWKVITTTNSMMAAGEAVKFYQPQNTSLALQQVFDYFSKLADQYSVPSYAHGDSQVGGAGNTASGLSMLMTSANRIIKAVVKNTDAMIKDSITKLYRYNVQYEEDMSKIGDVNIVAKGSRALSEQEQRIVRRNEFLAATNNPTDIQIMGLEGRRELLLEVARSISFDNLEKILPTKDAFDDLAQQVMQMQQQAQEAEMRRQTLEASLNGNGGGGGNGTAGKAQKKASNLLPGGENPAGESVMPRAVPQQAAPQMRANLGGGE